MGKINLVLSDELEKQFREAVFRKFGLKRGNIQKAVEEALKEWMRKQEVGVKNTPTRPRKKTDENQG